MKTFGIVGAVFFFVGIGLLTGSFFLWRNNEEFRLHALKTEGVVVDFAQHRSDENSITYSTVVEFKDQNEHIIRFSSSISSSSPGYHRGNQVTVFYNPDNPQEAQIDSFMENWFGTIILGGLGALFTLLGAGFLISQINKYRVKRWLNTHGMPIQVKLKEINQDTSINVNDRHPWRLYSEWQHPVTGKVYLFESDPIWFDPTDYMNREYLNVLVNADNPKQYHMNIDFLPSRA